jgi:hypothetical protein
VDVVRNNSVVEYFQPIALLRLEQPLKPTLPVSPDLEKELLLMASMSDVPDLPRT